MTISDKSGGSDDKKFNETLIRMLKTPPKPKEKAPQDKDGNSSPKESHGR